MPGIDDVTELWAWGSNKNGLLGIGDTNPSTTLTDPCQITLNEAVTDISMSETHVLCCTARGEVFVWGINVHEKGDSRVTGTLGIPNMLTEKVVCSPTCLSQYFGDDAREGNHFVVRVCAGRFRSHVITRERRVFTWGIIRSTNLPLEQPRGSHIGHSALSSSTTTLLSQISGMSNPSTLSSRKSASPRPVAGSMCEHIPVLLSGLRDVEDIHTQGDVTIARTLQGALYRWDKRERDSKAVAMPFFRVHGDHFVLSSGCGFRHTLIACRGSGYATVVYGKEERLVSAAWHTTVDHLVALVERVWEKQLVNNASEQGGGGFVILDGLGNQCEPEESTAAVIKRMLLNRIQPVFYVTTLAALVEKMPGVHLHKSGQHMQWGTASALMSLLYLHPHTCMDAPHSDPHSISLQSIPPRKYGYLEVFTLVYSRLFRLKPGEVFQRLKEAYESMDTMHTMLPGDDYVSPRKKGKGKGKGKEKEKEKVVIGVKIVPSTAPAPPVTTAMNESFSWRWIPPGMLSKQLEIIKQQVRRTRKKRILHILHVWLQAYPSDFLLGSDAPLSDLLSFLGDQASSEDEDIAALALTIRRYDIF